MVREFPEKDDRRWNKKQKSPFHTEYRPETNTPKELGDKLVPRYQWLIGILCWSVELIRIEFATELCSLSSHNCDPREGNLKALYQIFKYIEYHKRNKFVFDPTLPDDQPYTKFDYVDWSQEYGDVQENKPDDMPEALRKPVK